MGKINSRYLFWLVPLLWLLALSVPHLEQGGFRTDTGRYAAVGLQMWDRGDLLYSYTQPESPYFRKPPVGFWIHGFALKTFGVDLAVARVPSIIAAAGTLLLTFLLVLRHSNVLWAFSSSFILAITYEFTRRTREISLDHWQLVLMFAAVVVLLLSLLKQRHEWRAASLAGILFGLSLLVKPLMGGIGFGAVGLWLLATQRMNAHTFRLLSWVLLLMLIVGGSWHVYMYAEYGPVFLDHYLGGEIIKRLGGDINPAAWDYYPRLWLATYWPWLPLLVLGLVMVFTRQAQQTPAERDLLSFTLIWLLVWLIVLFALPDKRPRYAVVIYPALAIISAYGLLALAWLREFIQQRLLWLAVIPLVLLIGLSLAPLRVQAPPLPQWPALFAWMDTQNIRPRDIWEQHIYDGDAARFYLHYREWPRPAVERLTGRVLTVPAGSLLLYDGTHQPPADAQVLFQQDELTLIRTKD